MTPVTWEQLRSRCYVPYSDRKEVCIVEGKSDICYPGVRIENNSFPLSMDAIQVAIFSCLSEGDEPAAVMLPQPDQDEALKKLNDGSSTFNRVISEWCDRYCLKPIHMPQSEAIDPRRFFQTEEQSVSFKRLQELTSRCLIPYSDFPVSVLLLTDKGLFSGVNIEVDDWQRGLCAERVALGKARSAGATTFLEIHVYTPKSDYASPCGACRQVLVEWMNRGFIMLAHNEDESTRLLIPELLPYQFKPGNLLKKHH